MGCIERDLANARMRRAAQTGLDEMRLWLAQEDCGCDGDHVCGRPRLERSIARVADALSTPAPAGKFVTLEQLREIEWSANEDGWPACPACGGLQGCAHKETCWLAAALRKCIEEETI